MEWSLVMEEPAPGMQSSNPVIAAITVHNSMLSSVFPKKNPMAHSSGLSSDTANAAATTLLYFCT